MEMGLDTQTRGNRRGCNACECSSPCTRMRASDAARLAADGPTSSLQKSAGARRGSLRTRKGPSRATLAAALDSARCWASGERGRRLGGGSRWQWGGQWGWQWGWRWGWQCG